MENDGTRQLQELITPCSVFPTPRVFRTYDEGGEMQVHMIHVIRMIRYIYK